MLYDIAPPLIFFGSLGGIIFLVSRVIGRLKRRKFSAAVQAEGRRNLADPQDLLNPEEGQVRLVKSRLAATARSVRQSFSSLKQLPAHMRERRAERVKENLAESAPLRGEEPLESLGERRGVRAPRSTWRQQLSATAEKAGRRLGHIPSALKNKLGAWQSRSQAAALSAPAEPLPPASPAKPRISLRRIDTPAPAAHEAPRTETTAQRLQAFVRKQRSTTTPVQEAETELAAGNLDRAEDILIPYIAKHPRNPVAYTVLGEIALKRQSWEEAMESFEQVLRLDEATPGAFAKLGKACLAAGRVTRALEALQRAHDADPQDANVLKQLLNIAQRTDNLVLQKSVTQKLIVLAPDDPSVHLAAEALEARENEREQTPTA